MIDKTNNNIKINIFKFLKNNNLNLYPIKKLQQDASSRNYYRIKDKNVLLMESVSKDNKNKEFVYLSEYLISIGLSAPKIFFKNQSKTLYIIEDLGDLTFTKALRKKVSEETLYMNATKLICHMQNNDVLPNVPKYNYRYLLMELNIFIEWFFKEKNIILTVKAKNEWIKLWKLALKDIVNNNNTLVARDFHADNLFWLPNRPGVKNIGLIDFQDALIGHIAYDLSSLLEDVRRKVSKEIKEKAIIYFMNTKKIKNKNKFYQDYYTITAQRNAKIVGIFIRLARKNKKTKYLKLVNKTMDIFLDALKKANLNEILNWLEKNIPKEKKINYKDE